MDLYLIAVKYKDLATEQATQRLDRLCLSSTSWSIWIASKTNSHCYTPNRAMHEQTANKQQTNSIKALNK